MPLCAHPVFGDEFGVQDGVRQTPRSTPGVRLWPRAAFSSGRWVLALSASEPGTLTVLPVTEKARGLSMRQPCGRRNLKTLGMGWALPCSLLQGPLPSPPVTSAFPAALLGSPPATDPRSRPLGTCDFPPAHGHRDGDTGTRSQRRGHKAPQLRAEPGRPGFPALLRTKLVVQLPC